MKTIPQPVDTKTCQPGKNAGTKVNAKLKNVEDGHHRKTKKPCLMKKEEPLQMRDVNVLNHSVSSLLK